MDPTLGEMVQIFLHIRHLCFFVLLLRECYSGAGDFKGLGLGLKISGWEEATDTSGFNTQRFSS